MPNGRGPTGGVGPVLDAGPTAAGWDDQRWALTRIRDLIAARFRVQYTIPRTAPLRRRGLDPPVCQSPTVIGMLADEFPIADYELSTTPDTSGRCVVQNRQFC